jgi:hypothetical protein
MNNCFDFEKFMNNKIQDLVIMVNIHLEHGFKIVKT